MKTSLSAAQNFYHHARVVDYRSALAARRALNLPPLRKADRLADERRLEEITAALAERPNFSPAEYYGHPARRAGIVYAPSDRLSYLMVRDAANRVLNTTGTGYYFAL